ncbi:hypothetical protein D3C78_981600 [compost metagenome]
MSKLELLLALSLIVLQLLHKLLKNINDLLALNRLNKIFPYAEGKRFFGVSEIIVSRY